jgi:membrane dipeptidase
MVAATDGGMRIARTSGDLRAAFDGGPIAAVVGLEGADPLCGRAENLRPFFESGVRDVIFAWKDNLFSGTAFGADTPLTGEGERLLGLCEELGVMVDVSHLSDTAFAHVCRASTRPFIASHSNCRALCPSRRNLTDDMIRALADRGGVMGINLATSFLSPESFRRWETVKARIADERLTWQEAERRAREEATSVPRPGLDWIARHVVHAMDVGGEDVVGLGGDLDGIVHTPEGVNGVEEYPAIPKLLRRAGLSETQVEKICYRNLLRIFSEVLPS